MQFILGWFIFSGAAVFFAGSAYAQAPSSNLLEVVKASKGEEVQRLLDSGADAHVVGLDGSTTLLWASYQDDLQMARTLLAAGVSVNQANDLGVTPLWAASENGSGSMTALLLEAGGDPNITLLSGESPVMVAARAGSVEVVRQLALAGADLDRRATRGQTALMWAAAQEHAPVVETLLEYGADVHVQSDSWAQYMAVPPHSRTKREIPHGENTALMFASRVGDLTSVRHLVSAGADVNDRDAWGMSATAVAAFGGHTAVVEALLTHGADPNAFDAGVAPLHNAVMRNDTRMAGALLERGADANARLGTWTPVRRASRDFHYPAAFVGATPFWLASRFARTEMMRLLVDFGANPGFVHEVEFVADGVYDLKTERTTTLMAALAMGGSPRFRSWAPYEDSGSAESRTLEAVAFVADLGVDLNATNANGRSALDEAEARQYESVVIFLVDRGAGNP